MSLDLSLALLFDFAQECKRLSVGGFDVHIILSADDGTVLNEGCGQYN